MQEKRSPESTNSKDSKDTPWRSSGKTKVTNPEVPFPNRVVELLQVVAYAAAPQAVNPKTRALPQKTNGMSKLLVAYLTSAMSDESYEDMDPGFKAINHLLLAWMAPLTPQKVALIGILKQQLIDYNRARRMWNAIFQPTDSRGCGHLLWDGL